MKIRALITAAFLCMGTSIFCQDLDSLATRVMEKLQANYDVEKKQLFGTFKFIDTLEINVYEGRDSIVKSDTLKSVIIEIKDGVMFDIKAFSATDERSFYYNKSPTNIHSFNTSKNNRKLWSNKNKGEYIKLMDFVTYTYENGKRFIIEKEHVKLTKDLTEHKVYINNNLKSAIDFRVYSDFLGLIDESSNGIVSFEGNSTFYLNPFSLGYFNYIFKKFKTTVRYSRFDNDDRATQLSPDNTLDLIQKSFINLGAEVDIYEHRSGKKFPYKLLLKGKGTLDLTETIGDDPESTNNTTTLGIGFGAGIQIERYSNFGVNGSFYFNRYQNNDLLDDRVLNFDTFSVNTEAYFYVPDSNDAFFLRLRYEQGRKDLNPNSNFFNIQFGYKAELNLKSQK